MNDNTFSDEFIFSKIENTELDDNEDILAAINEKFSSSIVKLNRIDIPEELSELTDFSGDVYGYTREDTGFHIIFGWDGHMCTEALNAYKIGSVNKDVDEGVQGSFKDGKISFVWKHNGETVPLLRNIYEMSQDAFSRNAGLLESDYLNDSCAIFAGLGSVGSTMALMLARAGVGRYILIDPDILEIHNISRHQGDLSDVGRTKVDIIAEKILRVNPNAEIKKFASRVQDVDFEALKDMIPQNKSVVLSGCDKLEGNASACDIAEELKIPFLATSFFSMAWGVILYYYLPKLGDIGYRTGMQEALRNELKRDAEAIENNELDRVNHIYATAEDVTKFNFQPGVGADVVYGCGIAVKLALDLLNAENENYIFRLLPYLHQYTQYVLNRDPRLGGGDDLNIFANRPFQYWTIPVEGSEVHKLMMKRQNQAENNN